MMNRATKYDEATVARAAALCREGVTVGEAARQLQLDRSGLYAAFRRHGVPVKKYKKNVRLDHAARAKVVARMADGASYPELVSEFGVSEHTIQRIAAANRGSLVIPADVQTRKLCRTHRRLPLNEHVFDTITDDSAYWIGMLMADGCVHRRRGRGALMVSLVSCAADGGHVRSFAQFLGAGHRIHEGLTNNGHPKVQLNVSSTALGQSLARWGVSPRKTFTATAHLDLVKNRHFWRGVIDGDGSLGTARIGRDRKPYPLIQLAGALPLLTQFADYVRDVAPGWRGKVNKSKSIWQVMVVGHSAIRVIGNLYSIAATALPRKAAIAAELLATDWQFQRWPKVYR